VNNICTIHGFNSGPGRKSETLKNNFPGSYIYGPQLNNEPFKDIELFQDFINRNTNIHIVGTSLGGFYGLYLALTNQERDDISFYLINPSYTPYNNLKSKINQSFQNYKNNSTTTINKEFLNELKILQDKTHSSFKILPNIYFYFGKNDNVVNHDLLKSQIYKSNQPYNMFESDQGHRHEDISLIINQIRENSVI